MGETYEAAGVSIDSGEEAVRRIAADVKSTFRPEVIGDIGGFGGLFRMDPGKYRDPVLVSTTDGVGTKLLLARIHRKLSHCEGSGHDLEDNVLDAVWLKPHKGHWDDSCSFVNDMRIAIAVADELCGQRKAGQELDFEAAVIAVENTGGYGKSAEQIANIYEEIASTVGGFREMSSC